MIRAEPEKGVPLEKKIPGKKGKGRFVYYVFR